jgi:hypothetical protein
MGDYTPKSEHKFTFGLWTVGNIGRDPFGEPVRPRIPPTRIVQKTRRAGRVGRETCTTTTSCPSTPHPPNATASCASSSRRLDDHNMRLVMGTTNLFTDPAFKDGAFTSNDPKVRAYALQKSMHAIDLAVELGAEIYVFLGRARGHGDRRRQRPHPSPPVVSRVHELPDPLCQRPRLPPQVRAGAEAQRAARGHLPAHCRRDAGVHRDAGRPQHVRREPRSGARTYGRVELHARRRAGD